MTTREANNLPHLTSPILFLFLGAFARNAVALWQLQGDLRAICKRKIDAIQPCNHGVFQYRNLGVS